MKQHSYETTLKEAIAPVPDAQARVRARRAALAEFNAMHATQGAPDARKPGVFQGLLAALRLSRERNSHGSDVMPWSTKTRLFAGAASVCVALIGFAVAWPIMKRESTAQLAPVTLPKTFNRESGTTETGAAALKVPDAEVARTTAAPLPATPAPADSGSTPRAEIARESRRPPLAAQLESKDDEKLRQAQPLSDAISAGQIEAAPPPAIVVNEPSEALQRVQGVTVTASAPATAGAADESMEEIITTGARGRSPPAPHKGVAPPPGGGATLGGLLTANKVAAKMLPIESPTRAPPASEGRDKFEHFELNSVKQVTDDPVSTFSADVDTSSYSFVRKQLNAGVLPQKDAVRAEEMVNYFDYSWPVPESREQPFKPTVVVSDSPWGKGRKLIHIGIKGYELPASQRPDANLVLLIDVSGSMDEPDKLPLVKDSLRLMLNNLKPRDTVAMVVYAGAAGLVLPPTAVGEKEKIIEALDRLQAGGSTAGAAGIELAYELAEKNFRKEGVNRILLCTDGDFNVGIDGTNELKGFVERKREKGIFLSVLGFGQGNYRDELAQALAQNGNGVAAYIDTLNEARKVLVQEAGSSLFTIAKDVKLQVEFNPATVAEYRLVGYETRALKREDFNNDAVDAGDVGSGHSVTAIYEITPVGVDARMVDKSRYASDKKPPAATGTTNEYGFLKIRYKLPESRKSELLQLPITIDAGKAAESIQRDVEFSTAVAGFAQLLRGGTYTGALKYEDVIKQALASRGEDPFGYRNEFVQLVRKAQAAKGM